MGGYYYGHTFDYDATPSNSTAGAIYTESIYTPPPSRAARKSRRRDSIPSISTSTSPAASSFHVEFDYPFDGHRRSRSRSQRSHDDFYHTTTRKIYREIELPSSSGKKSRSRRRSRSRKEDRETVYYVVNQEGVASQAVCYGYGIVPMVEAVDRGQGWDNWRRAMEYEWPSFYKTV